MRVLEKTLEKELAPVHYPDGPVHDGRGRWDGDQGPDGREPQSPGPSRSQSGTWRRWIFSGSALLIVSLAIGAVSHGLNIFSYPLYITDEGVYMQQAWSVLRQAKLSPYTYFYDHAPGGWLFIAAWVRLLPFQLETFGNAINTGRVLMVLVHLASVFLLFRITHRLSGSLTAAFAAAFFFNVSPLAIFYQRQVLLDNIMVLWVLFSLYLATGSNKGVMIPMLSGMALGVAALTKENAVFFTPIIGFLLYTKVHRKPNYRFALGFWAFSFIASVSLYFLYATLKDELFPTGLDFDPNNPPADHVSLLYTLWWQLHRSQGSVLDPSSLFWEFSLNRWIPKDVLVLAAGAVAMLANLVIGLLDRRRYRGYLVAAALALGYTFYLIRGSLILEFYVVPLIPFLAMNIGMLAARLLDYLPALGRGFVLTALFGVLLFHPIWGYTLQIDEFGKVVTHDLYKLDLTYLQAQQVEFIRENIPPNAKIVMDDDLWVALHDVRPYYRFAHSHWKVSADPDVRDKLFAKNWRNIDYFVMSNRMLITMQQNNGDGRYDWILEALNSAKLIWSGERPGGPGGSGVRLEIYQVQK